MPTNFTSPVGRMVQGDAWEAQTTDQQGAPRVIKSGPRAGQPAPQWFVALAFAKNDPAWPPHWAQIVTEAANAWPSLFPHGARPDIPPGQPNAGGCVMPTFAFKVIDGDGYDTTGKSNATKEGFAGHWIVRYTSGFAPKVYRPNGPGVFIETTDKSELKRGFYARIAGSMVTNSNATKPGLHLNVQLIEISGRGDEIVSGPSAQDAFAQPAALPAGAQPLGAPATPMPGASAAPPSLAAPPPPAPAAQPYSGFMLIPSATMPPGQTVDGLKAAGWTEDQIVTAGYATRPPIPASPATTPPGTGGATYTPGVAAGAGAGMLAPPIASPSSAAPPPAPAAPPPAHQMTAKAAGATYEAMRGNGWTDEQLVAHGYMLA